MSDGTDGKSWVKLYVCTYVCLVCECKYYVSGCVCGAARGSCLVWFGLMRVRRWGFEKDMRIYAAAGLLGRVCIVQVLYLPTSRLYVPYICNYSVCLNNKYDQCQPQSGTGISID